ncbi:MAG: hypothetical protein LBG60_12900 [Bifidobacteriaceae bacterium]|jgi:hypothetical protein|nr:hypothetical protein [Bifidobacteriaceae bacterium]
MKQSGTMRVRILTAGVAMATALLGFGAPLAVASADDAADGASAAPSASSGPADAFDEMAPPPPLIGLKTEQL